jgi:hypothetical protein
MTRRRRTFEALISCLRGEPPAQCDWMAVFEVANQSLVTPALAGALRGRAIPPDAAEYLSFILERNTERNTQLRAQLAEAATALNGAGIVPVVLKGGAWLVTVPAETAGERMIMDLDVMVPQERMAEALGTLKGIGYEVDSELFDLSHEFQADLRRPSDAAMIDLHRRPPGPAAFNDLKVLYDNCAEVACGDGRVLVPSPTLQALHLIAHDQFQDGDLFLGHLDLRHLLHLASLARSQEGIDFGLLAALMPGRFARHALETQLLTAHRLLGVDVPNNIRKSGVGAIHYRRRLLQLDLPILRLPLTALTILVEWAHFRDLQRLNRAIAPPSGAKPPITLAASRLDRLTKLLTLNSSGKL